MLVVGLLAVLANVCATPRVRADDEDDELVAVAPVGQFVFTEQQFDQMVFGGQRAAAVRVVNGVQRVEMVTPSATEADFRKRMEAAIAGQIQVVNGRVLLTEAQKKKLQLAGRGGISQFLSRVADLRRKLPSKPMDRQQYTELLAEMQPLRQSPQSGIIGEHSLFWKTLRGVLNDEQAVRLKTLERERQKQTIEIALLNCEQRPNRFVLLGEKRQKFVELILDHGHVPQEAGSYSPFIVLLEANLLGERIKPLLTEAEWQNFELQVAQAKQYMPILERTGQWTARRPNEDDEVTADLKKD